MSGNEEQNLECPLCMEPLEMDDINFFPCTCGYQICRFCWHRIRTDENGLCPACRKQYPEDPADFKPLSIEELQKIKNEKKQKDLQRKQKISENRKHLSNVRVVQRNLVFVVGLPPRLAEAETLKKHEYFGKFGKIHKVVVNNSTTHAGSQTSHSQGGQSASAYVTYLRAEDALRAIQAVNNIHVDNRTLKASLGTTKYCSHFLKNQQCPKPDCMYLHELGDEEASFTKEEMQHGKHQEYEKKLHDQMLGSSLVNRKQTPSPVNQQTPKELWPSLLVGKSEKTINGLTKHQLASPENCSKDQSKGIISSSTSNNNLSVHQGGKCRHGSGEEIFNHKSKKCRERSSDDKQHKGSKERTHKHNNNNNNSNINPVLQHVGTLEPNSSQSVTTVRPSSCGSSSGTDSSTHSSTSSLNCTAEPNPVSWPTSSPSNEAPVTGCVNPNATNSPGSLSPSLSESPVQSTPYGSLSSSNAAPSPPPPVITTSASGPQGLSWSEPSSRMSDILPGYPVNQTSLHLLPYENNFLNGPMSSLQSAQQQQHPQTRSLQQMQSHVIGKMENGLSPGMMFGVNGVSRLHNGDWSRSGSSGSGLCQDIPVSSSNTNSTDWQAAFGFGPTHKSQDDDLGFDPWDESSKGLADLLEKEAVKRPPQHTFPFSPPSHSHPLQQQQQHHHMLLKQQQLLGSSHYGGTMEQVNGLPPSQQQHRRVAPPPPGFTPNHVSTFPSLHRLPFSSDKSLGNPKLIGQTQQQQHPLGGCGGPSFYSQPSSQDDLQSSQLRPGLANHLKQVPQNCIPPHLRPKLSEAYGSNVKDWQDGLRSLLPNISISFGPSASSQQQTVGALPSTTPQKSNLWNGQSPDLSWSTQDSSILSNGSLSDYSGRESPPHWMKSLQQLTLEDGSVAYSNHHIPHSPLFAYRGGSGGSVSGGSILPPLSSSYPGGTQGPPPGFTAPLRACETHKISENL